MSHPNNKNYIIVIIILAIALISLAYIIVPQISEKAIVHLNQFPNQIVEWRGVDVKVDQRAYETLNSNGFIFKEYTNKKGEKIQLAIVLGLNKRESFHPPEVCYSGGGGTVDSKTVETLNLAGDHALEINKLVVKDSNSQMYKLALFWFTAGNKHFANYYQQQIEIVLNQLKYRKSWGALIRVSTDKRPNEDVNYAAKRMEKFINDVYPILPRFINPRAVPK